MVNIIFKMPPKRIKILQKEENCLIYRNLTVQNGWKNGC